MTISVVPLRNIEVVETETGMKSCFGYTEEGDLLAQSLHNL